MPAGDRTGPMGMGSRTGRGLGYCSGSGAPGFASGPGRGGFGFRRGFGRGFSGYGRGMGARFFRPAVYGAGAYGYAPAAYPEQVDEKEALKAEADALKSRLDGINARLDSLSAKKSPDA